MLPPEDYREQARLLVEQAQTATPERRITLLKMAETFVRLASESAMLERIADEHKKVG